MPQIYKKGIQLNLFLDSTEVQRGKKDPNNNRKYKNMSSFIYIEYTLKVEILFINVH